MIFNERKYKANLLSSERILVGETNEIRLSIVEVFTRTQPVEAYIRVRYGEGRTLTTEVDWTLMLGTAPIFTHSDLFSGITAATKGILEVKITDSDGDTVLLEDNINIEFIL